MREMERLGKTLAVEEQSALHALLAALDLQQDRLAAPQSKQQQRSAQQAKLEPDALDGAVLQLLEDAPLALAAARAAVASST